VDSRSEPVGGSRPFHVYTEVSKVDQSRWILGMDNFASKQRRERFDGWILVEQS